MLFTKMPDGQVRQTNAEDGTILVLDPSPGIKSILSRFSDAEVGNLMEWAATVSTKSQGVTNLTMWPGWRAATMQMQLDGQATSFDAPAYVGRITPA